MAALLNLFINMNKLTNMKSMLRKYDNIKQIDLTDRDHPTNRSSSRFNSHSKSSHKGSFSRDHNDLECPTDRSRPRKVNEFNCYLTQSPSTQRVYPMVKSNIKTYIRFKPFTKAQMLQDSPLDEEIEIVSNNGVKVKQNTVLRFDYVFSPESCQKQVYDETTKELVSKFTQGCNATVFAYGQTGSGKTYTMFGDPETTERGIILQAISDIFWNLEMMKDESSEVSLSCSMLEIYKESLIDLLADESKDLKIKDNAANGVQIQNLHTEKVSSQKDILNLIAKGSELRKIRGTDANERSSRSHLIFTIYLQVRTADMECKFSKLNLVDLAGSEKVSKTKVSGEGLEEAKKINLSLACLGNTINALSKGQQHIPYRDSKLTRVLQESLSGNSLTRVIVTCSLHQDCRQQTISSLKFGSRAKKIKTGGGIQNVVKMTEAGVNKYLFQSLKISYQSCEQKLQKVKHIIENCHPFTKEQLVDSIAFILRGSVEESQGKNTDRLIPQADCSAKVSFKVSENNSEGENQDRDDLLEEIKRLQRLLKVERNANEQLRRELKGFNFVQKQKSNKEGHKLKILKVNNQKRQIMNAENIELAAQDSSDIKSKQVTPTSKKDNTDIEQGAKNGVLGLSSSLQQNIKSFMRYYQTERKSYERMEREILNHQISDLIQRINNPHQPIDLAKYRQQVEMKQQQILALESKFMAAFSSLLSHRSSSTSPAPSSPFAYSSNNVRNS